MGDNGKDEVNKKCPFLNGLCIGDACAVFTQLTLTKTNELGVVQTAQQGMCSLPALCVIMSSQPQRQPQLIQLPGIRGG